MKKVLIFIIGFLIVSCSKDDSCVSETNTSLVSITKKYYSNNNFTTSAKYNFYDNKLLNILYSDGSYEDYQYNNNLVSRILKFNSDDSLFWTITYLYDSLGRIIEIKRIPSASNSQLQITAIYSFEYTLNQILITVNFSPGDTIKYQILLNQENKIIKEMVISINGNTVTELPYFSHIYLNGNLSESVETFLNLNNPIGQTKSISYNDKKNDFNYNKYLFGNEWKINTCLDHFSKALNFNEIVEIMSENLVSGYTHNYNNISDNATLDYVFNEKNQIVKEVLTKSSTYFSLFKSESIYEYK